MKRRLVAATAALALFATAASPAFADQGSPGSTYPEQPGTNVAPACNAILTGPGQGFSNDSDTAFAIQSGLFTDACSPG
jgi:hypothetical protein